MELFSFSSSSAGTSMNCFPPRSLLLIMASLSKEASPLAAFPIQFKIIMSIIFLDRNADFFYLKLRRFLSKNIPSCGSFCPSSLLRKCSHNRAMLPFPRREDAQKSSTIRDILFRQSPNQRIYLASRRGFFS